MTKNKLKILMMIPGDLSVDDRGKVTFINAFNFEDVKRFYVVENHRQNFIRAWHGHKREGKYVFCVNGSALVAAVKIDDWLAPSKNSPLDKFVLSSDKPAVLFIPPGYANGFMTLSSNTKLVFFSTSSLEESVGDDFRFDAKYWNAWEIKER